MKLSRALRESSSKGIFGMRNSFLEYAAQSSELLESKGNGICLSKVCFEYCSLSLKNALYNYSTVTSDIIDKPMLQTKSTNNSSTPSTEICDKTFMFLLFNVTLDVNTMFDACAFEMAVNMSDTYHFCSLFDEHDAEIIQYSRDLKVFVSIVVLMWSLITLHLQSNQSHWLLAMVVEEVRVISTV